MGHMKLSDVRKSFGDLEVIRGVDLEIGDEEFVVFVGPSGSGKSTLLRLVAGLEAVSSGRIEIDGHDMTRVRPSWRGLAMVFQNYALYPHMTVRQNMSFGLKMARRPKREIHQKVEEAARTLQIESYLERKPGELSGGQRQRVAIGRAIVRDPTAFLFDEPLSNLDAELRVQMRLEIARLRRKLDATIVYVTHDQVEAMTLADKIVVLRDGLVEQIGSPLDLYHHPTNRFVAGFIGSPTMNFLSARIAAAGAKGVQITLDGGAALTVPVRGDDVAEGAPITLGIRPEHLRLCAPDDAAHLTGRTVVVERLGGATFIYVAVSDDVTLTVQAEGDMRVAVDDAIGVTLDGGLCHLFRPDESSLPPLSRHYLTDASVHARATN